MQVNTKPRTMFFQSPRRIFHLFLFVLASSGFSFQAFSQNPLPDSTATTEQNRQSKKSDDKKDSRMHYIVYAGGSLNNLNVEDQYQSEGTFGFQLGGAMRKDGFFYWQPGLRYAFSDYRVSSDSISSFADTFGVHSFDIPVDVGINLLPFTDRIFNLRIFLGVMPSFALGVSNGNSVEKSDINSFNFYGQGGIGVDVAFLVVDVGYNYGFTDLLKNDVQSNPGQIFLNLGFRF